MEKIREKRGEKGTGEKRSEDIHKQWKLARLKKELRARLDHPEYGSGEDSESQLQAYMSQSGRWVDAWKKGFVPSVDVGSLGFLYQRQGAFAVLDGDEAGWQRLALGTLYALRATQFYLVRQDRIFKETNRAHFGFEDACRLLAQLFALGWNKQAHRYGRWLITSSMAGYYFDSEDYYRNCANWFYLRLFADSVGASDVDWPPHSKTVPEYEVLLNHWRTDSIDSLLPHLTTACDRHTHECFSRSSDESKRLDFADDVIMGWPIEIHMILRLRSELGLANPEIDHQLMQTGLGRMPEPLPLVPDELLEALTAKACEIYPELGERL
ncbi:MAG: hypothetical protein FHK82_08995 [Sedimenticola thiotaurini]|uniref:DUF1911 domain-containing protein n=1 Tax=Sedimenticola thiotaurini TaxID=1543721 RepID=A0A558D2G3_9GAMM|nr:MAG: hypothetical protein FHK82_08995 [Sedimenticola thiotaurini]